MKKELETDFTLLTMIKNSGDIMPYLLYGTDDHIAINDRIELLITRGYITSDEEPTITTEGQSYLAYLAKVLKKKGLSRFILPQYYSKVPKKHIEDIYIPKTFREK